MTENRLDLVQRYFDAWNRRDAAAIVAMFADGGTYADPTTPGPLRGEAIGAYAQGLWAAFPDLFFDSVSIAHNDSGLISAEWLMKGTNTGSMMGLPATGLQVELPGADFVQVEGDKIRSVRGYFDSGALPRALGLDVIVQPRSIGPFGFGVSTRASSGSKATPGAFSITCLDARTHEERIAVKEMSQKIVSEMLGMPGFISWVGAEIGDRMMTITAWETKEDMLPMMKGGEHRAAVGRFFNPEIARGGVTGVWVPSRLNAHWARCEECSKMVDSKQAKCGCGAALPDRMAYW